MARGIIISLMIAVILLTLFKAFGQNAGSEDTAGNADAISRILANQQLIIEKLNVIDAKIDGLKRRIY